VVAYTLPVDLWKQWLPSFQAAGYAVEPNGGWPVRGAG
jgi:hypothetical protein